MINYEDMDFMYFLEEIAKVNGTPACMIQAIEECSELTKACCKWLRLSKVGTPVSEEYTEDKVVKNLIEEIVDVFITIVELGICFEDTTLEDQLEAMFNYKIARRLRGLFEETGNDKYFDMAKYVEENGVL